MGVVDAANMEHHIVNSHQESTFACVCTKRKKCIAKTFCSISYNQDISIIMTGSDLKKKEKKIGFKVLIKDWCSKENAFALYRVTLI